MVNEWKQNCWEFNNCGRELGGDGVDTRGLCPASMDECANGTNGGVNAGRICWAVAGAFCGGPVLAAVGRGPSSCLACGFMTRVLEEEGKAVELYREDQGRWIGRRLP